MADSASESGGDGEVGPAGIGIISLSTRRAVLLTAVLCLAGLGILFWETFRMAPSFLPGYPGDAFFPRLVIGFSTFWAFIIVIGALSGGAFGKDAPPSDDEADYFSFDWLHFIYIFALVIAYALLLQPLGFEIVTLVLMFVLFLPRVQLGWLGATLAALAASVGLTLLFWIIFIVLLRVHVPLAVLPRYLNV